ncbi:hypothetical protein BaRGS_00000146, partial [Batillaria attramentaria]
MSQCGEVRSKKSSWLCVGRSSSVVEARKDRSSSSGSVGGRWRALGVMTRDGKGGFTVKEETDVAVKVFTAPCEVQRHSSPAACGRSSS